MKAIRSPEAPGMRTQQMRRKSPHLLLPLHRADIDARGQAHVEARTNRADQVDAVLARRGVVLRVEIAESSAAFDKRREPVDAIQKSATQQVAVFAMCPAVSVEKRAPGALQPEAPAM